MRAAWPPLMLALLATMPQLLFLSHFAFELINAKSFLIKFCSVAALPLFRVVELAERTFKSCTMGVAVVVVVVVAAAVTEEATTGEVLSLVVVASDRRLTNCSNVCGTLLATRSIDMLVVSDVFNMCGLR